MQRMPGSSLASRVDLPPEVTIRTEVPLRLDRDLRAWTGSFERPMRTCKLEAETVLYDLPGTGAANRAEDGR